MYYNAGYLGCDCGHISNVIGTNAKLNVDVVNQINESQELCMLRTFEQESSEYQLKKCIETRISEISSWHWVLKDLTSRLGEALSALDHERDTLGVVVERLDDEINVHSRGSTKPGALKPFTDPVEDAIMQEYKYLCEEKRKFERMLGELSKRTQSIRRIKKRLHEDLSRKEASITIEENISVRLGLTGKQSKRKKSVPGTRWQSRCESLKLAGLEALRDALDVRERVRYARVNLSVAAQTLAARVDSGLKRRLHHNQSKLEELQWQKEEAIQDLKKLSAELTSTEKVVLEIMERIGIVDAMLSGRNFRHKVEKTRDVVDTMLRKELGRLNHSVKELNGNISNIKSLERAVNTTISQLNCCSKDLTEVIELDCSRIQCRRSSMETSQDKSEASVSTATENICCGENYELISRHKVPDLSLTVIMEENEDDYPFD